MSEPRQKGERERDRKKKKVGKGPTVLNHSSRSLAFSVAALPSIRYGAHARIEKKRSKAKRNKIFKAM